MWHNSRTALILSLLVLTGCASGEFGIRPVFGIIGADGGDNTQAPYELGKREFEAGRFGLAVKYFRQALNLDPLSIRALNGLAAAYDKLRRYDLSARIYGSALTLDPNSAQTLNNVGYSYFLQRKYDLAATFLREAASKDAKHLLINGNLQLTEAAAALPRPTPVPNAAKKVAVRPLEADLPNGFSKTRRKMRLLTTAPGTRTLFTQPELYSIAATFEDYPANPSEGLTVGRSRGLPSRQNAIWLPVVRETNNPISSVPAKTALVARKDDRHPVSPRSQGKMRKSRSIEVANGTGRSRMASRMRNFLSGKGHSVQWLTNADTYKKQITTLFYKPGMKESAETLATTLPSRVLLILRSEQRADLHVELGADLLSFDRKLYYSAKKA